MKKIYPKIDPKTLPKDGERVKYKTDDWLPWKVGWFIEEEDIFCETPEGGDFDTVSKVIVWKSYPEKK